MKRRGQVANSWNDKFDRIGSDRKRFLRLKLQDQFIKSLECDVELDRNVGDIESRL